jgi:DNA-directed RNA polymerase
MPKVTPTLELKPKKPKPYCLRSLSMDLELSKTEARFIKQQERLEKDFGWGVTVGPMAITRNYLKELADKVPEFLKVTNRQEKDFIELIQDLPKETIALCCLQTALHLMGQHIPKNYMAYVLNQLGKALEGECYAQGLMDHDKKLAKRLDRLARSRHGNSRYRRQAVRSIAKKNGYVVEYWSRKQYAIAGNWAMNLLTAGLPDVFSLVVVNDKGEKELALTENAFTLAEEAIKQAILADPVYLPIPNKPKPWTDWNEGGSWDLRFKKRANILRSRYTETAAHVRGAIATGTMSPALEALNSIQAVGYKINTKILELVKWCHTNCVQVSGLPRAKDLTLPLRSKEWSQMSESEQKAWKIRANQVKKRNRGFAAERVLMAEDLATAEYLEQRGTFYTPCNMDWRGRVYPLPHFNYQREDRVRALFLFANGMPITEEAIYWLKVHLANTGDFEKVSKKSFDERVLWVDRNIDLIIKVAENPFECAWWQDADKPFQFVAACMEVVSAIQDPEHITHLPISFDGSCSGLQHLSAMTQAAEGALVNLVHSEAPNDVYSIVAERVKSNLEHLLQSPSATDTEKALCNLSLEYGVTRSLVKRNVMTYGYSSQKFGMAGQLVEDLMQPLALEVLAGEREYHPFGNDNGFTASRFLASQIFQAIEEVVKKPAEAMGFLRQMAKALAHENKPVTWITPAGIPWINRYHTPTVQRVTLWLNDKGVTLPHAVSVASGFTKQIDKTKAANSIAPNFVHALDASHLMFTVNALRDQGVNDVALVHDSFGVLAPNAVCLGKVLRQEFVRLYTEFDPLNDILASNVDRMDTPQRLPSPVKKGPLDLKEILNAEYAFS